MKHSFYTLPMLLLLLGLGACKHSSRQDGKGFQPEDFYNAFPQLSLPYSYDDDSLRRQTDDSLALDTAVLHAFVADSIWDLSASQRKATRFFPLGRLDLEGQRLLLIKTQRGHTHQVFALVYGAADTLLSHKEVAAAANTQRGALTFRVDTRHLLTVRERKVLANGHVITREWVYGVAPDGSLSLILTNSSEPAGDLTDNPIDTLPGKGKYSGDYRSGKEGLVSIRDGREPGTFLFYIHLSRNNGDCTGEVSGSGKMTGKTVGEFHDGSGPCGLRFGFSSRAVTLKEIGGCGAYRGISCYFEGTYTRQKNTASP